MSKFSKLWDTEVKTLASKCITEPWLVELLAKGENYAPTEKEIEYLEEISGKYLDIYGMYYISEMIWRVEHELADHREIGAMMAVSEVYEVLSRESYFKNVFNNDDSSDEWKTRADLRDGIKRLLEA